MKKLKPWKVVIVLFLAISAFAIVYTNEVVQKPNEKEYGNDFYTKKWPERGASDENK